MKLASIKTLQILSKKEQTQLNGGNINPLESCEAQATISASIDAFGEHFFQEFYEIYYQIAYENCINGTWNS
ncbi:hypothetical protein C8N46_10731 [Kordia periserrulae]|uniref:Uncharacterized protein n=1 Tax=Kordia periserrulae TaxID=701523 RepID=A0A2T6BVB5_9FLAO|nr:hypothetical protein [Kordia periserrulae]PTX60025.1 hypothetical protein C8N46_10731 [Kordia periserrulae]